MARRVRLEGWGWLTPLEGGRGVRDRRGGLGVVGSVVSVVREWVGLQVRRFREVRSWEQLVLGLSVWAHV